MLDIKDFLLNILKDKLDPGIEFQTGRLDEKEKSVFITNDVEQVKEKTYNAKYFKQNIAIILHWNDNYTETRKKALEIYKIIKSLSMELCDENTMIIKCKMDDDFPSDYKTKIKIYAQEIDFQVLYIKAE